MSMSAYYANSSLQKRRSPGWRISTANVHEDFEHHQLKFEGINAVTCSSECRTTRLGSYSSQQDDPTPSRCFAGCRSSRESCTKQQCSHSRSVPPRHHPTSAVTYRHVTVRGIFDRLAPRCCHDLPPGLTSPRAASVIRHLAAVWNSLPRTVLDSPSLTVFKSYVQVRYMLSPFRLSSVCRLSVCRLYRWCALLSRLKFSAIFLRRLVPWPSIDIHGKFYGDRPRGTPQSGGG